MSNPLITTALIAAAVSLATTLLTNWLQFKSKMNELEHTQLKDVLAKRMDVYPRLWCLLQTYVSNWKIEGKARDEAWATDFLTKLNSIHADYGAFFSEPVYERFFVFRNALIHLSETFSQGGSPSATDLDLLEEIYSGKDGPGLATRLKDDLGSYRPTIFGKSNAA